VALRRYEAYLEACLGRDVNPDGRKCPTEL